MVFHAYGYGALDRFQELKFFTEVSERLVQVSAELPVTDVIWPAFITTNVHDGLVRLADFLREVLVP